MELDIVEVVGWGVWGLHISSASSQISCISPVSQGFNVYLEGSISFVEKLKPICLVLRGGFIS